MMTFEDFAKALEEAVREDQRRDMLRKGISQAPRTYDDKWLDAPCTKYEIDDFLAGLSLQDDYPASKARFRVLWNGEGARFSFTRNDAPDLDIPGSKRAEFEGPLMVPASEVPEPLTRRWALQMIHRCFLRGEDHEFREALRFGGQPVYDPHGVRDNAINQTSFLDGEDQAQLFKRFPV